jgi:TRAP-type C4-dicarboxylate transport system substrate-binding protein
MTKTLPFLRTAAFALALAATAASAQSSVAAIAGQAEATDTVIIQNMDTGFSREVKPKANGRYQLRNLPTGTFSVTVRHADGSLEPARVVSLRVGQTARVQ